jgi:GNAT superfamily N-acetyltransferase
VAVDPSRADWRLLRDDDGRTLAAFLLGERDGRLLADLVEPAPGVPTEAIARCMIEELRGWKVAGDVPLGRALAALGARPTRHAHVRSRDLLAHPMAAPPPPPPGIRIGPLDRPAHELADIFTAAYPPGHADWTYGPVPPDLEADLAAVLDGSLVGPRLEVSRLAIDPGGRPAGALVVTDAPGEPPFGGPWVAELFRAPGPELRGTGRALLEAGLAAATAAGLATLGLAVSEGNPAERLYAALGFERILSSLGVVIPG